MDLSIPPKAHGMEDHVMMQMTTIRGGIGELIEYWIEQYHQTGFKYDMKYRNMPNELAKAMVRARREKASMNNNVIKAKQQNQEKHTGKRKANAVKLDIKEAKKKKRIERRHKSLQKWNELKKEFKCKCELKIETKCLK